MMNTILRTLLCITVITLFSCTPNAKNKTAEKQDEKEVINATGRPSKAELLVAQAIEAHGGKRYDSASYGFTFRDKSYTFKNSGNGFRYTVNSIKNGDTITDNLANGKLTRTINGKVVELSEKDDAIYTEALNSVIYFVTLPSKLNDKAVNKMYEGRAKIKDQEYELLVLPLMRKEVVRITTILSFIGSIQLQKQ